MRCARCGLLFLLFLPGVSGLGQQPASSQQVTSTQPASDPQAVAVVQAAITAMGGAQAISQIQGWTLQGELTGPSDNGIRAESIAWADKIVTNSAAKIQTRHAFSSPFVSVLLGAVLLKELQSQNYLILHKGTTTLVSESVTVISISLGDRPEFAHQTWYFDNASNLPARVDLELPAQIGVTQTVAGMIDLSDYRSVQGVLYPFHVVALLGDRLAVEVLTIQSVNAISGGI